MKKEKICYWATYACLVKRVHAILRSTFFFSLYISICRLSFAIYKYMVVWKGKIFNASHQNTQGDFHRTRLDVGIFYASMSLIYLMEFNGWIAFVFYMHAWTTYTKAVILFTKFSKSNWMPIESNIYNMNKICCNFAYIKFI